MEQNGKKLTHKTHRNIPRSLYLFCLILILTTIPLISADWVFNNVKSDLIEGDGISEYGRIEIDDWYGLKKLMSLELKENTESCPIGGCSANTEIIMYEDGKLIDNVRFIDLGTGKETSIESYEIYVNGNLYNYEEVSGYSKGAVYDVELRGNLYPFQSVDWQIKSAGTDWINDWAAWTESLNNSLVAYYKFDKTSGHALDSVTESTYNLTNVVGIERGVTGKVGLGFEFNGSGSYLSTTPPTPYGGNGTISLWVRYNSTTQPAGQTLMGKADAGSQAGEFEIRLASQKFDFIIEEAAGQIMITSDNAISPNLWQHVVMVYNDTDFFMYVNGSLQADMKNKSTDIDNSADGYYIGAYLRDGGDFGWTNGTIDEIGIWNRTLNATEISDLWNNGDGISYGYFYSPAPTITLNAPPDNYNTTNGSEVIIFNCSGTVEAGNSITNISLYHNASGTWTLNQTNSTERVHNSTSTFDVVFGYEDSVEWNCYACANNSLCVWGTNRTIITKKVFVNSQTYNSTTWETDRETFIVNVSGNGLALTANLLYNGTSYAGTKTGTNYEAEFTKTLDIPTGTGDKALYWEISSSGTPYVNSTEVNQTVNQSLLGLCNATLTIPYINFTFKDEEADTSMDARIDSSTWTYYLKSGAVNKSLTFSNTSINPSYAFCFIPEDRSINIEIATQYSNESYPQRRWDNSSSFSNTTTNVTLYLLDSADGIYVTFQVLSQAGQPISGIYATAERTISGSSVSIGAGTTGDDGGVTFWLNPDYSHDFTFSKTGYDTVTKTITPTQATYTIYMGAEEEVEDTYDYSRGITYYVKPVSLTLSNQTDYHFNLTITSTYWDLEEYGFVLRNSTTSFGSVSDTTGTGGTVDLLRNAGTNKTIIMEYYWIIDGNYTNYTKSWHVSKVIDYGYGLKTFFTDLKNYTDQEMFGLNEFSRTLIIFIIIFVSVGAMCYVSGIYSPAAIMWEIFVLVALFDVGVGLLPNPVDAVNYFPTIITLLIAIGFTLRETIR